MSNSFAPKATWVSDDDMLEVFSIASDIEKCLDQMRKSDDHRTVREALDAEDVFVSRLMSEIAIKKGPNFEAGGGTLQWSIRSRHSDEVIASVLFTKRDFLFTSNRVGVLNVRGNVTTNKKSRQVISLGTERGKNQAVHCGTFYRDGQKVSFFESLFN